MKINGTPHPRAKHFTSKPGGKNWAKKMGGGKGSSGCLIAALTFTALATGWLSMVLTSWRPALEIHTVTHPGATAPPPDPEPEEGETP